MKLNKKFFLLSSLILMLTCLFLCYNIFRIKQFKVNNPNCDLRYFDNNQEFNENLLAISGLLFAFTSLLVVKNKET